MTVKIKSWDTAEHFRDEAEIDAYLESSFADGDIRQITRALDNAARARGMVDTARRAGLDRAGLYRALSGETDPRLSTVIKLAGVFGGRIAYVPNVA
jgi:probable addiction module antidote protein